MTAAALPDAGHDGPRPLPLFVIPSIVATAFLMEAIDQTIVTACIPAIARSLHTTPLSINLAITSYLLSLAVFIPISGWTADRLGARRVFVGAIAVFVFGSILCAMATSLSTLVAARVVQGLGGAMMTPTGRLILLRSVDRKDLVVAIAYMTTPVLLGPLLGPLLGGIIAGSFAWQWIFLINIPIGILGVILAFRYVPVFMPQNPRPFDMAGFAMCSAVLVAGQVLVENTTHRFLSLWGLGFTALVAAGAAVGYGLYWKRRAWPVIDLTLFRIGSFRRGVLAGGVCRVGLNALPFVLQMQLQIGFGYSALHAGSIVFALAIGTLLGKPLLKTWVARYGYHRMVVGTTLANAALAAGLYTLSPQWPQIALIVYLTGLGFFRSMQFMALNSMIYSDVPKAQEGASVTVGSAAQQLFMGLGISLSAVAIARFSGGQASFDASDLAPVFLCSAVTVLVGGAFFLRGSTAAPGK